MGHYQAIVVGLGAMGAAATYQLARRGVRVLGVDRFSPPHALGSTHGETRVTRLAIGEGAHYTPFAVRSHELWREIEAQSGADLLTTTGALIMSSPGRTGVLHVQDFFGATLAAAKRHGIAHELLDAGQIRRRFPQFAVRDDEVGYFEPEAGFLRPEACVSAQLDLAQRAGAEIRTGETVLELASDARAAVVTTDRTTHTADRVILAVGPWLPQLLGERYQRLFKVSRQVLYWFAAQDSIAPFLAERFPVFIWEQQTTRQGVYGFPAIDGEAGGVKIATEHHSAVTTPDAIDREVSAAEIAQMYETCVGPCIFGLSADCVKTATCLYTVTPDFGFILDTHPAFDRVIVASPCSGHGFKHSAAIGEALAELVVDGRSRLDLGPFGFSRFW
ncbi:MAG: N-methyl-L-tryptophan oxidase [Caulobacterales bacterium]